MATIKSSAITQLADMTECCICLKTFTDPRILPCIHTFCLHCLKEMVDNSDKKPGDRIQCPICRTGFALPNDGVHGIQKNFFMAGMIEVRNALNQSVIAFITCDACKAKNDGTESKMSKATLRCFDCQENLCEDCSKMHKASKISENHKILNIDCGFLEEEAVKTLNVMNCDIHRGKALDYYCADCKKVVCVSCFVESHKAHDCKDVNTVDEEFRQLIKNRSKVISTLAGELLAKKEKMESKDTFLAKIAVREKAILGRRDELKEMIDQHAKWLLSTLDEMKNRHLKEIQAREDELDRQLIIVESFKRYCDELSLNGSAGDVCRNKDALLVRAEVIIEDHETYFMHSRPTGDVVFVETDLQEILKTTNGNVIGSLKENDECSEAFALIANDGRFSSHKINLHSNSDKVSPMQHGPTTGKSFPDVAFYNNAMFITGVGNVLDEIWRYNFTSGWKQCGSLVHGRRFHCSEFVGDTLYICGGSSGKIPGAMNHVEAYNAVTETSIAVGQLKTGSDWASCVAYKGSIYVFGGFDKGCRPLNCVQVFDPVEKTCTLLSTPLPRPVAHMRALSWNAYAILLDSNTCFVFDFDNGTWEERKEFKADAETANFGMVHDNGRIFIIDGSPTSSVATRCQSRDHIKYIKASSICNDEAPNWRPYGRLPQAFDIVAVFMMSLVA